MRNSPTLIVPTIDHRDWSKLAFGEQLRQLELEGYLVLPDLLTPDHIARLKEETSKLPTRSVDYSVLVQPERESVVTS